MLELAPSIAQCLNSGEIPEARRQVLVDAFCDLLSCCRTKVQYLANVGFLIMNCSQLRHLHLEKGWGEVWGNLSKIATALVTMLIITVSLQHSCSCVKGASVTAAANGCSICSQKTPRNRQSTEMYSSRSKLLILPLRRSLPLHRSSLGMLPLLRCLAVEKNRFQTLNIQFYLLLSRIQNTK